MHNTYTHTYFFIFIIYIVVETVHKGHASVGHYGCVSLGWFRYTDIIFVFLFRFSMYYDHKQHVKLGLIGNIQQNQ